MEQDQNILWTLPNVTQKSYLFPGKTRKPRTLCRKNKSCCELRNQYFSEHIVKLQVVDRPTIPIWKLLAKGTQASNLPCINIQRMFVCATNRDTLLLATLRYLEEGINMDFLFWPKYVPTFSTQKVKYCSNHIKFDNLWTLCYPSYIY